MKGIILAGGTGSRLWPITSSTSKQILPVYDKPLIYYSLSTLMLAGIREVLIITKSEDLVQFKSLLHSGSQFGISIQYAIQKKPSGIAEAFIIGEEFIGNDEVCLILGDNIFYGEGFGEQLDSIDCELYATIFAYTVSDPERYGVVEIGSEGLVKSIQEKPVSPKSALAIPGIYFYPNSVIEVAKNLKPSFRGELEITDVNIHFMKNNSLRCNLMRRGTAWFDTGTFDSLNDASTFIRVIEQRQGFKISCPEEIALRKGFISKTELRLWLSTKPINEYTKYLERVLSDSELLEFEAK